MRTRRQRARQLAMALRERLAYGAALHSTDQHKRAGGAEVAAVHGHHLPAVTRAAAQHCRAGGRYGLARIRYFVFGTAEQQRLRRHARDGR